MTHVTQTYATLRVLTVGLIAAASITLSPVFADDHAGHGAAHVDARQVQAILHHILVSNAGFVNRTGPNHFHPFLEAQHPKVTVISCCDSRVQMQAISAEPDNELFVIRNIGNQISTAEGSVEYGVHHLHTPVLLILGHTRCGAIKAASGEYSSESQHICKELNTLKIAKGGDMVANVTLNVNNQVTAAVRKFEAEVKEGKLTVIGALYDFANDLKHGYGRLTVINVNGDCSTDKTKAYSAE